MFYKEAVKKLARYAQMHYLNFSGKIHLVIEHWGKFLIGLVYFFVFLFTLQIIFKLITEKIH